MSALVSELGSYFRHHTAGIVSVYLFGSRARGTQHRDSDIDVAVLFDREALPARGDRSRAALELSNELIALTHCNAVDVVVLNDATPELARQATEDGVRAHCNNEEMDRRFRLLMQLRYIDLAPFLRRTRRIKVDALKS